MFDIINIFVDVDIIYKKINSTVEPTSPNNFSKKLNGTYDPHIWFVFDNIPTEGSK